MNILFFNFRDIKHSAAGGSEVVLHRIAESWAKKGHKVTIFTSFDPRASYVVPSPVGIASSSPQATPRNDIKDVCDEINGVRVIRRGGRYTLYIEAVKWWFKEGKKMKFDVVIDMINTIPFFTPLFVKGPKVVAFIHQLARKVWFYETKLPIAILGFLLELLYLRFYCQTPTITISESTKSDLVGLGFCNVTVISIAIDQVPAPKLPIKPKEPRLLFVGRLVPSKRPFHVYEAFKILSREFPKATLVFCGSGVPAVINNLKRKIQNDGLEKRVKLAGWVKSEEKRKYMCEAWAIAVASVREGWGLIVTEANSQGTPAVVYNIRGLRDAVRDGETGIVTFASPEALAEGIRLLWSNPKLLEMMRRNAWEWSKKFSWEKTAGEAMGVIVSAKRPNRTLQARSPRHIKV